MQRKDFLPNSENTGGENRNTIFLITYAIVLIVALLNMNATMSFLGWVFAILNPFIIGLVIAFVINIIMTKLESNVFRFLDKPKFKLWRKMKRGVCLGLSFLLIILVFTALIFFIGPQLARKCAGAVRQYTVLYYLFAAAHQRCARVLRPKRG